MAAESRLRIAVVGTGQAAKSLAGELGTFDEFELVPGGVPTGDSPEVVVLVHEGASEPQAELAELRRHVAGPVILAATAASSALVQWSLDAGVADVLALPAARETMAFAIEKASRSARQENRSGVGRVVTVFSPKGGSGKSVVSTNIAVASAAHGNNRTLLLDLDLQFGDAAIMLGLEPHSTVRDLIETPSDLDAEKLYVYTERHSSGVDVLPAPMNPEDAELVSEEAIRALLGVARCTHDVVVVDTAPFFYGPMLATLEHTDELLVVCNPDLPTLKNVRLTLKTLEQISFPEDRLRIVLNRASGTSGMERGDVEAALQRKVDFLLPLDPTVPLAVNNAAPAILDKPEAPFASALLELARSVTGGDWSSERSAPRSSRIFGFGKGWNVATATHSR